MSSIQEPLILDSIPSEFNKFSSQNVFKIVTYILLNSLIWGITNPLLKYFGSLSLSNKNDHKDTKKQTTTQHIPSTILHQLISLFGNWKFVLVQLINWCGSLFFLLLLGYTNLTTAVICVNSLTCVITELTDIYLLGHERKHKMQVYTGIGFILLGILICNPIQ